MRKILRKFTSRIGKKDTIEKNLVDSTPSANRKLDLIFEILIEKFNQPLSYQEIFQELETKNVTLPNIVRGIKKAEKDGYVMKYSESPATFFITHDGEVFQKDGGYTSYQFWQFWRDKDLFDKIHKLATIILTIVALYFAFQNLNLKARVVKLENTVFELNASVYHLTQVKPQEPPTIKNTIIIPDTLFLRNKVQIDYSKQ